METPVSKVTLTQGPTRRGSCTGVRAIPGTGGKVGFQRGSINVLQGMPMFHVGPQAPHIPFQEISAQTLLQAK